MGDGGASWPPMWMCVWLSLRRMVTAAVPGGLRRASGTRGGSKSGRTQKGAGRGTMESEKGENQTKKGKEIGARNKAKPKKNIIITFAGDVL